MREPRGAGQLNAAGNYGLVEGIALNRIELADLVAGKLRGCAEKDGVKHDRLSNPWSSDFDVTAANCGFAARRGRHLWAD